MDFSDDGECRKDVIYRLVSPASQQQVPKHLRPILGITSPLAESPVQETQVSIKYVVRSPSGDPIRRIAARINGELVEDLETSESEGTLSLRLPAQDCTVSLVAYTDFAASEKAELHLQFQGNPVPVAVKPKLYLLAVGIGTYQSDESLKLDFPAKMLRIFAMQCFIRRAGSMRMCR